LARGNAVVSIVARAGLRLGVASLFMIGAVDALQNAVAEGDTRTLSFHHMHTGEDVTITFKRDGRYDDAALKKLDWFMRDWRKDQSTHMDPHLFDLLWQVYREVGANQPIQVVCGFRSPGTNAMLRRRSSGVAQFSQHTLGHAIDFYIPGVALGDVRAIGLQLQRGGVGFYPTSGSPFVHMDTGTVRHWPSIPRETLVKIFPNGKTVHVPADGRPLPGYALALREVEKHGNAPNARSLEAARAAGMINDHDEQVASVVAQQRWQKVDLADAGDDERSAPLTKPARAPMVVASLSVPKIVQVKKPAAPAKPVTVAVAMPKPKPAYVPPFEVASAEPIVTGSAPPQVLAYAAESTPVAPRLAPTPAKARPMGARFPRLPRLTAKAVASAPPAALPVAAHWADGALVTGGQQLGSPWMRAVMLTPSIASFMTMSFQGTSDLLWLGELIQKPQQAVAMTFSADPQQGMVASRFTGSAVVFLATAKFVPLRTASLQ
jgi:uncharacterized protein YcbK (DUF882 family)